MQNTVLEGGAKVYGIIPEFLLDQEKGHEGLYTLEIVKSMPERKTRMINLGDAFIALPGGPGTLEEISEIISLRRLNRTEKPCILYNIEGFYEPLKKLLEDMVAADFLPAEDLNKVVFASNLDEIKAALGRELKVIREDNIAYERTLQVMEFMLAGFLVHKFTYNSL